MNDCMTSYNFVHIRTKDYHFVRAYYLLPKEIETRVKYKKTISPENTFRCLHKYVCVCTYVPM